MVSIDTCVQVRPVCWRTERGPGTRGRSGQDVWLREHYVQNGSTTVERLLARLRLVVYSRRLRLVVSLYNQSCTNQSYCTVRLRLVVLSN